MSKPSPPLIKRSSLISLPDYGIMRRSRTPPVRSKLCKEKKAMSLESLCNDTTNSEYEKRREQSQIRKWSESFTKLLEDHKGVKCFLRYLETEHSSENIRFWIACEKYKQAESEQLTRRANDLYNEFLCGDGINQVNIDSFRLKELKKDIDKPNAWIFEQVQRDIFLLMKRDSYPRFLKSSHYATLLD